MLYTAHASRTRGFACPLVARQEGQKLQASNVRFGSRPSSTLPKTCTEPIWLPFKGTTVYVDLFGFQIGAGCSLSPSPKGSKPKRVGSLTLGLSCRCLQKGCVSVEDSCDFCLAKIREGMSKSNVLTVISGEEKQVGKF